MNIKELAARVKAANAATEVLREPQVAAVLREAFSMIRDDLARAGDGESVRIPGLGQFRVKSVERQVAGQLQSVRRVLFVPAAAKPGVADSR